jgi:hypothetical protein
MSVPGQEFQQGQFQNQQGQFQNQQGQFQSQPGQYQQGSSLGNFAQGLLGRMADHILPPKGATQQGVQPGEQQYGQTPGYQQVPGQNVQQQGLLPSLSQGLFHHGQQQVR